MESGSVARDYDYVVFNGKEIKKVANGIETLITEEEWSKLHPEHHTTGCKQCSFVSDAEALLVFSVTRERRASANHDPAFVGMFTMPKWSGHSGFYLFKCQSCGNVCVDYPHGYTGAGYLYLRCGNCRYQIVLTSEHKNIYEREKMVVPPSPWRMLWTLFLNRKKLRALKS